MLTRLAFCGHFVVVFWALANFHSQFIHRRQLVLYVGEIPRFNFSQMWNVCGLFHYRNRGILSLKEMYPVSYRLSWRIICVIGINISSQNEEESSTNRHLCFPCRSPLGFMLHIVIWCGNGFFPSFSVAPSRFCKWWITNLWHSPTSCVSCLCSQSFFWISKFCHWSAVMQALQQAGYSLDQPSFFTVCQVGT